MIEIVTKKPAIELQATAAKVEVIKPTYDNLKEAYQDGYTTGNTDGYNTGYSTGSKEGYTDGYADGEATGYESGKTDGYEEGYNKGWNVGNNDGLTEGYNNGYATGKEDGKQAEYDAFWDAFQSNGARTEYTYSFGRGWRDEIFKPKYDLKPVSAYYMFCHTSIGNLEQALKDANVKLDMSQTTDATGMFYCARCNYLPEVDCRNFKGTVQMFGTCWAHTIRKMILREDGLNTFSATFALNTSLKEIRFEGVIGNNIDFRTCTKLTYESIMDIIAHLKDFSGTTETKTLTLGTTNLAKLTDEEKAIATQKGWTLA